MTVDFFDVFRVNILSSSAHSMRLYVRSLLNLPFFEVSLQIDQQTPLDSEPGFPIFIYNFQFH